MDFLTHLRRKLLGIAMATPVDMRGRNVVVTGCAPGSIGYETARVLLEWGADVTITTRANTQTVVSALARTLPVTAGRLCGRDLDLMSSASVTGFVDACKRENKPLDVLINNAGIHLDLLSQWSEPHGSPEGIELHWRVNYLGTVQLTLGLLPLLLAQVGVIGGARVVNVVSMLHDKGSNALVLGQDASYNSWRAYGASKLALMHFGQELHRRHGAQGLQVTSLHPGAVATNIGNVGLAGNTGLLAIKRVFSPLESLFMKTPLEGAQTSLHCATALGILGGGYYRNVALAEPSADARDPSVAPVLWDKTLKQLETLA